MKLFTALTPTECVERLKSVVLASRVGFLPPMLELGTDTRLVFGQISERALFLRKTTPFMRNSFETYLSATLQSQEQGTMITVRLGMHPLVLVFSVVLFFAIFSSLNVSAQNVPLLFRLGPFFALFFFGGIILIGKYLARDHGQFLVDFLTRTLDARIMDEQK